MEHMSNQICNDKLIPILITEPHSIISLRGFLRTLSRLNLIGGATQAQAWRKVLEK